MDTKRTPGGEKEDPGLPLYDAWKSRPGPRTLTPLVTHLDPVIEKALGAYGYAGDSNMRNTARVMAIRSLPRFDPKRASLGTFVFGELRRMQRVGPQQEYPISVPEGVLLDRSTLQRATSELYDKYGRDPTDDEISDHTGLSAKRLRVLRSVPGQSVGVQLDAEGNARQDVASVADDRDLWADAVRLSLDPTDQKIYEWSTGRGGERFTSQQIAKRLNISPSAVSQRAMRIAKKLAEGEGIQL